MQSTQGRINIARMTPVGAQAFAARNLELLAAIENTLDALSADTNLLHAIHAGYREIHEKLEGTATAIDEGGRIQGILDKAGASCARIYHDACQRHQSACQDPQLRPDDGVADAYSAFIDALRELHDTIEYLREWIATHDAVLQPTTGTVYASADDLFAALLPRH
ncbi:hypothetical protein [Alicycliphilus denitrificans]|uniref:hypothetical protein n=1 Tax=Alicycliphilus denitrificans TaxID=179636 RepID=UPI000C9F03DE|nr:hypothetical protein [Alicycliphilus denitrificans]